MVKRQVGLVVVAVKDGPYLGVNACLYEGSEVTVGSSPDNHLCVPGGQLRPYHFRVDWRGDEIVYVDCASGKVTEFGGYSEWEVEDTSFRMLGMPGVLPSMPKVRMLNVLGVGGFGEVYRALYAGYEKPVALKIESLDVTEDMRRRLEGEARLMKRLDHRGIPRCLEVFEADGRLVLVIEEVRGENMRTRLHRFGAHAWRTAAEGMLQVARALQYAHDNEVIHRDLKPENLVYDEVSKEYRLIDFGLAKEFEIQERAVSFSRYGSGIGSWEYLAPESLADESLSSWRSDIYSFGAIFYELLTNEILFSGECLSESLEARRSPIPDLPKRTPGVIGQLIKQCLKRSPESRLSSLRPVIRELEALLRT